ncbi:cell division cycle 20.5, cofactor of APC complex-like isoform X3 [Rhododendron vialii]|uniref:cell division cycle 20.5, cofactor of APC complex-like isoform X3 n=1 Tax=Rhododendron vialii TaxID=182163 RepID=UPI00265E9B67|nr:cell division cycle 20.5, cofactor of APC complex-like isoform X3 [Rhododendron vialii]
MQSEASVLDAPNIRDDYYSTIMDWGKNNLLAVALGSEIHLWNAKNRSVQKLLKVDRANDYPSSVAWSNDAKRVAVGHQCSEIQLWDAEAFKYVRSLEGHQKRVGALAWNGHILTSGSQDKSIINHDVRVGNSLISRVRTHASEVCGLKWSSKGNLLASGGNDNLVYIWEAFKIGSSHFLHRLNDHRGAVKALAWCPYDSDILASGGGTKDGCIKLWNVQRGLCINSIGTNAQVCGLEWNRHHKEILSGHGFSTDTLNHQLCLWQYPSMSKMGGLKRHSSRVLQLAQVHIIVLQQIKLEFRLLDIKLCNPQTSSPLEMIDILQSPDGLTVMSAGADQTLRVWEIFGPPKRDNSRVSELDGLLSLKTSPIR